MRRFWNERDTEILRSSYPDMRTDELAKRMDRTAAQVYTKANMLGIKKSAAYLASPESCRLRRGGGVGVKQRFYAGQIPWNKGMKGLDIGGKATQFKTGIRPHNAVPVNAVVMSSDGYLKMKIAEPRTWLYLHRKNWEEAHGPIPKGMCLLFIDGVRENCAIENLRLVSRKELMLHNTIHNYSPAIKDVMHIRAGLVRRINDLKRKRNGQ